MKLLFVAHNQDTIAMRALGVLSKLKHSTRVLSDGEIPDQKSIALFSTEADVRNRCLRLSRNRMEQEGIQVPGWAKELPFVVAINKVSASIYPESFRSSLWEMAKVYASWGPWMRHPKAPWNPVWRVAPHESFVSWSQSAKDALAKTTCIERLEHRMRPIFTPNVGVPITHLTVTGCALFNKPHTDVTDTLVPEKLDIVRKTTATIIEEAVVSSVSFVVPRSDLLRSELRDHFHPFIFMDVAEVAKHLGSAMYGEVRLFGRSHYHTRGEGEIAAALERSGDALERNIVDHVQSNVRADIVPTTWTGYIGPYIKEAHRIALRYTAEAERIYEERVRTRPSFQSLHKLDPGRGLKRTIANNVFYIAEAMYLKEHPQVAVVNFEFADTYWKGLEGVLEKEVWGSFRPFIGMVPEEARQPWAY